MPINRPILIAECCQNHNGKREILKQMIHAAAESGADYCKIQAIRSKELTFREQFEEGAVDADGSVKVIKRPYSQELERLAQLDLPRNDEQWFVDECWRAGIAPMTTVFTRVGVREVCDMGYEAIKIASYDCSSYPLLRDVRQYWKQIFVSTGATYDTEIAEAAEILTGTHLTFLHCVTIYPTPISDQHLRRISWLRRFTPRVGFSDHTKVSEDNLWASKIALALGATCIERHFTIQDADQTRDGPISVTPPMIRELREFAALSRFEQMDLIKYKYPNWEVTLGKTDRPLSNRELLNRDYYMGRFASKIGDQVIYNWEDVDIDHLMLG